jgi:hypothetical protein
VAEVHLVRWAGRSRVVTWQIFVVRSIATPIITRKNQIATSPRSHLSVRPRLVNPWLLQYKACFCFFFIDDFFYICEQFFLVVDDAILDGIFYTADPDNAIVVGQADCSGSVKNLKILKRVFLNDRKIGEFADLNGSDFFFHP